MRPLLPAFVGAALLAALSFSLLTESRRIERLSEAAGRAWSLAEGASEALFPPGGPPEGRAAALAREASDLARLVRPTLPSEAGELGRAAEALRSAPPGRAREACLGLASETASLGRALGAEAGRAAFRARVEGALALMAAVFLALWAAARRGQVAQAFDAIVAATRGAGPPVEEVARLFGKEAAGALFVVRQLLQRAEGAEERLRQETVSRYLMSEILRDLSESVPDREAAMMEAGRRFARRLSGSLRERLETYERQGLGRLRLERVDGLRPEAVFVGQGLFESLGRASLPQDHFARGFLAETVEQLTGSKALCEEVACRARGDPECRFVVYPLGETDVRGWRKALEG